MCLPFFPVQIELVFLSLHDKQMFRTAIRRIILAVCVSLYVGREFVCCVEDAVKIRAEDGRSVANVDIRFVCLSVVAHIMRLYCCRSAGKLPLC